MNHSARKRSVRVISALLCAVIMILQLPLTLFALSPASSSKAAPSAPQELEELSGYLHASVQTKDNTVGLTVNVHTYYDESKDYTVASSGKTNSKVPIGTVGSVSVLYVMNTNTERIGTDTDEKIVRSLLDRGYFVLVLDYMNASVACGTDLDWSIQDIRQQLIGGSSLDGKKTYTAGTYSDGKLTGATASTSQCYILPAGYDIVYGISYFSYDQHGSAGLFERIVEIWNNDFKSVWRDTIVKWVNDDGTPKLDKTEPVTSKSQNDKSSVSNYGVWFTNSKGTGASKTTAELAAMKEVNDSSYKNYVYTYIGNTKAQVVTDCVKPNGEMIDLNLYMDVIYPTGYTGDDLPVMMCMSSSYTRADSWSSRTRPHLTGCLFNGYIGIVSDYALVPMCRDDHYGYYNGLSSSLNAVSGDNLTYSLYIHCGVESDSALVRTVRALGSGITDVDGNVVRDYDGAPLVLKLDGNAIGAYGNSKGGFITRLGAEHPELLVNNRNLEGHGGETRYEALNEPGWTYNDIYVDENGNTTDARIRKPEVQRYTEYASNVNLVFANCGGNTQTIMEGHAPTFAVGASDSYDYMYRDVMTYSRTADIPFLGLNHYNIGHDLGYGADDVYGIDIYETFLKFAGYHLKGESAECVIIDVDTSNDIGINTEETIDNIYEIKSSSSIKLAFTGVINENEIQNVKIADAVTGKAVSGSWERLFGGQQWKFIPYDIADGTYYVVDVPKELKDANGNELRNGKILLFSTSSGLTEAASVSSGTQILDPDGNMYVQFANVDRTQAHETLLRFAVTNDSAGTIVINAVTNYNSSSPQDSTIGEELGSVVVTGKGIYSFDIGDYLKAHSGAVAFRLSLKAATERKTVVGASGNNVGDTSIYNVSYNGNARLYAALVPGTDTKAMKLDYYVAQSQWIDLGGNLNGNSIASPATAMAVWGLFGRQNYPLTEADLGRRIKISFSVYDTTSRQISVRMGNGNSGDMTNFNQYTKSYKTKADDWTDIEFEFTVTEEQLATAAALRTHLLIINVENKSVTELADDAAIAVTGPAAGSTDWNANYAGKPGLNSTYIKYTNTLAAENAGKITVNRDKTYPVYFGDITFEDVSSSVQISVPTLSSKPQQTSAVLPTLSTYVVSNEPDSTHDGDLVVGGGQNGYDLVSTKTYVKLSLEDYASENAAMVFTATGSGKVAVYGVANVDLGQDWTSGTLTSVNAPANDRFDSGVILSQVWNNAAIKTFDISGETLCALEITEFARAMRNAGAKAITLVFVSDSALVDVGDVCDFETIKPNLYSPGYSTNNFRTINNGVLTANFKDHALASCNSNQTVKLQGLLDSVFEYDVVDGKIVPKNIGQKLRISFDASAVCATKSGSIQVGLTPYDNNTSYRLVNGQKKTCDTWAKIGGNYIASFDLSEKMQTFSFDITITEEMYQYYNGNDKLVVPALSFYFYKDFGIYNVAYGTTGSGYEPAVISVDNIKVQKISGEIELSITERTPDTSLYKNTSPSTAEGKADVTLKGYGSYILGSVSDEDNGGSTHLKLDLSANTNIPNQNQSMFFNQGILAKLEETTGSVDVGTVVKVSFKAKTSYSSGGTLTAALKENGSDPFQWRTTPGIINQFKLTTNWQTFGFEFTVTESMVAKYNSGVDLQLCFSMYDGFVYTDSDGNELYYGQGDADAAESERTTLYLDNIGFAKKSDTVATPWTKSYESFGDAGGSGFGGSAFLQNKGDILTIKPSLDANANSNSGQNIRLTSSLTDIWNDTSYIGKTVRVRVKAKASIPGKMTIAVSSTGTVKKTSGEDYTLQWSKLDGTARDVMLTTEYQTFTVEFKVTEDMYFGKMGAYKNTTNGAKPCISFFLFDGFRMDGVSKYKEDAIIYIDSVVLEEVLNYTETTLEFGDAASITAGNTSSTDLKVYANPNKVGSSDFKRTYLTFTPVVSADLYEAYLKLYAKTAAGQTVTVYAIEDASIGSNLTYTNAPSPYGKPIATFTVSEGENKVDITEYIRNYKAQNVTFILAIESASDDVTLDNGESKPTIELVTAPVSEFDPSKLVPLSNITLDSSLRYNVFIPVVDEVKSVALGEQILPLYELDKTVIDGKEYYVVTKSLIASAAAESCTLVVTATSGTKTYSGSYEISIPKYAAKIIGNNNYTSTEQKLMQDILAYISAATVYFDTASESVRAELDDIISRADYTQPDEASVGLDADNIANDGNGGNTVDSVALELSETPSIRIYLKNGASQEIADSFKFTLGDNANVRSTICREENDGRYYITVTAYAYAIGEKLSFTYTDANGAEQSGTYNLAAYHAGTDASDTALRRLVIALARYSMTAREYRAEVNGTN